MPAHAQRMSSLLALDKEVVALNMDCMSVTLDVSKLSGWLNADACCRVSQGGHTVRSGPGNGRRRATAAHAACRAGLDCRLGAGRGAERTANILPMSVTLDVSKLSGWSSAHARCRGSKGRHVVRGAVWGSGGSRRWTTAAHAACRGGRDCRLGAGHGEERTSNIKYMFVTLEVSKLSGWLNANAPYRVERRAYGAGRGAVRGEVRGAGRVAGVGGASSVCRGGIDCRLGERTLSISLMVVTLDVSKLSGWLTTPAPCRESKEGHAGRGGVYGSGCSRRWTTAAASSVQGRARLQIGGRARGGAHSEHVVHGCDTGGVPARNIRVEIRQARDEVAHVGDARDVPVGDGAIIARPYVTSRAVIIKGPDRRN